ncbi:amidase [Paracoccus sp. YIM 132242]|uniref:Amidase n=1 Tax=Paracoccus lichenicola TaxID=2665644 RepID=A0A6L6HQW2_9RHOB|nr:amidase [Paracoccus lichenicola]MTE01566.1 amidase [Paracoccus lichenicola]
MTPPERLDATDMAQAVSSGSVAPDHFLRDARTRIAAVNPRLNAVVHDIADAVPAGCAGPFAGVPLPLKNIGIAARGSVMSLGSRLFAGNTCAADNTLAARYRRAGFVFCARTNTPELALSFTAEPALHGPCRNPWDPERTAGGSSGGSAALVAAGVVPIAQSSDGAGSTRVPAAHCGVFGFKPSRMRNPVGPATAEGIAGMATPHAVSRSVRDSARMLDVGAGPDIGDPYAAPHFAGRYEQALKQPPERLRIGLHLAAPEGIETAPDCIAAARHAADLLADLGHEVVELAPPYDNAALKRAWRVIAGVSCAQTVDLAGRAAGMSDPDALLEPVNAEWVAEGRRRTGIEYLAAVQQLHRTSRDMGAYFQGVDVYLSPTTAQIAPRLGHLAGAGLPLDAFYDRFWAHAPLTAVFNASGCPAMSVPLYWTHAGLPVGCQFGAGFGQDALLFRLAAQLEAAQPWAHKVAPLPQAGERVPA